MASQTSRQPDLPPNWQKVAAARAIADHWRIPYEPDIRDSSAAQRELALSLVFDPRFRAASDVRKSIVDFLTSLPGVLADEVKQNKQLTVLDESMLLKAADALAIELNSFISGNTYSQLELVKKVRAHSLFSDLELTVRVAVIRMKNHLEEEQRTH